MEQEKRENANNIRKLIQVNKELLPKITEKKELTKEM